MIKFLRKAFEDSNSKIFWITNDLLAFVIIISTVLVLIETEPVYFEKYGPLLKIIEWIIAVIFTLEYIIYAILARERKKYIFSFYGMIDFLSFVPTYLGLFPFQFLKVLRITRLLRLLKLFRALQLLGLYKLKIKRETKEMDILKLNLVIYLLSFVILTIVYSVILFEIERRVPGTQIHTVKESIWSTLSALSSVGFGDVYPVSFLGRLFMGFIMLSGVGFLSFALVVMGRFIQKIIFGDDIGKELEEIDEKKEVISNIVQKI